MLDQKQIKQVKEAVEEFFEKMTITTSDILVGSSSIKRENKGADVQPEEGIGAIDLEIKLDEPQILIGQGGQTLFEVQRLMRNILNRKLKGNFYLNLDINDYKKKKIEYLKNTAKDLADQVVLSKEEKALPPMSSYERRVVHAELSGRTDVTTESRGDGFDRHIVILPK